MRKLPSVFLLFILLVTACSSGSTPAVTEPSTEVVAEATAGQQAIQPSATLPPTEPAATATATATQVPVVFTSSIIEASPTPRTGPLVSSVTLTEAVNTVAYSPDGYLMAGAGADKRITIWDASMPEEPIMTLVSPEVVSMVAFSPEGNRLASVGEGGTVFMWNPTTGRQYWGQGQALNAVAISPDGSQVVTGSNDGIARVRNVSDGKLVAELKDNGTQVLNVAFSPDGIYLAVAADDGKVRLYKPSNYSNPPRTIEAHVESVWGLAFSPDSFRLATGGKDTSVAIWNVDDGANVARLQGHTKLVWSVGFSPDGKVLASGSSDANLILWDVKTGKQLDLRTFGGSVYSTSYNPDGRLLVGSRDKTVTQWWLSGGDLPVAKPRPTPTPVPGTVNEANSSEYLVGSINAGITLSSLSFRQDLRQFVTSDGYGYLTVRDGNTPDRVIYRVYDLGNFIRAAALSPNGKYVAAINKVGMMTLWDNFNLVPVWKVAQVDTALAFSPDGRFILTGSSIDGVPRLWNVADGTLYQAYGEMPGKVTAVTFSNDGKRFAAGLDSGKIIVWDVGNTLGAQADFDAHAGGTWSLAFSADGKSLASGGSDGMVKLWDLEKRENIYEFEGGHTGRIWSVVFTPDGKRLVSAGEDGALAGWDLATRQNVFWIPTGRAIFSLGFDGAGRLLSAGRSGRIDFWSVQEGANVPAPTQLKGLPYSGQVVYVQENYLPTNDGKEFNPYDYLHMITLADQGRINIFNQKFENIFDTYQWQELGWTPDGSRVTVRDDGNLWLINPMDMLKAPVFGQGFGYSYLADQSYSVAPDGTKIAVNFFGEVDVKNDDDLKTLMDIGIVQSDGQGQLADQTNNQVPPLDYGTPLWTKDGLFGLQSQFGEVEAQVQGKTVKLWMPIQNQLYSVSQAKTITSGEWKFGPMVSTAAGILACDTKSGKLVLVNTRSGETKAFAEAVCAARVIDVSQDGQWVATLASGGNALQLVFTNVTTGQSTSSCSGNIYALSLSPDGQAAVVSTGNSLQFCTPGSTTMTELITMSPDSQRRPFFSEVEWR